MIVTMQHSGEEEKESEMFVIGTCIALEGGVGSGEFTRIRLTQGQWGVLAEIAQRKASGEDF